MRSLHQRKAGHIFEYLAAISWGLLTPEIGEFDHQCPIDDLIMTWSDQSCIIINQIEIAGR
jgi:hypothetical protein